MKKYFSIEIAIVIFSAVFAITYMNNDVTIFKVLASFFFCYLGFEGFLMLKTFGPVNSFSNQIMLGLIFGFLGDIFIEFNFVIGAIFFAIGHIFYIVALCSKLKFKRKDLILIIPLVIFSVILINVLPFIIFNNILTRIVCSFYGVIIAIMVAKAILNAFCERTKENVILAIGSVLFFISDFVLLINTFSEYKIASLCLLTYYSAQLLIAFSLSMYCLTNFKTKK